MSEPTAKESLIEHWKIRAKKLKAEIYALYYAYKDPRIPWYARLFIMFIVAYAFSPLDLIPDFVPILGYLDDLILIPLLITLALKMIPDQVMEEARKKGQALSQKPKNWVGAVIIIGIWGFVAILAIRCFF
ncbi:MAG: hypothetical protein JG781_1708 [Peptococcaceae bacterium]|jgi:uncharacterized membrane protein YkvA (DUF1232 family)|nr:hypothetical protein [Peptococcaceae bacterium]